MYINWVQTWATLAVRVKSCFKLCSMQRRDRMHSVAPDSRINVLCIQCFSAQHGCKERLNQHSLHVSPNNSTMTKAFPPAETASHLIYFSVSCTILCQIQSRKMAWDQLLWNQLRLSNWICMTFTPSTGLLHTWTGTHAFLLKWRKCVYFRQQ